jgi:hypothetical protein
MGGSRRDGLNNYTISQYQINSGIMKNSNIDDPVFARVVAAIYSGDLATLRELLDEHPRLVQNRLNFPETGYFRHPYLIWFVADNPIRNGALPGNIVEVTRLLIDYVRKDAAETYDHQINFTMELVSTGRIPRECGVQIGLIDLLIDSGAKPGRVLGVLAHDNPIAAAHILSRGGELTFAAAVGLGWKEDMEHLETTASHSEFNLALIVAAFFGRAELIVWLLGKGAQVNEIPADCQGFHSHATALHHAVASASLESVNLLVEAGADLHATDLRYQGTPLDWAIYLQKEDAINDRMKEKIREIESKLRSRV